MTKVLINFFSLIDFNHILNAILNIDLSQINKNGGGRDQDSVIDCLVQQYFDIEYYLPRRLLLMTLHPFITILLILIVYTIYRIVKRKSS